jgi:valyl-tRNA synthetase
VDGSEPPPLALDRGSAGLTGLDAALLSADDQHILAMLQRTTAVCTENLRRYRFNDAAHDLYEFVWHQFCDWYVEYSKDVLYGADGPRRRQVLGVMRQVLDASLRLLHPFMPFVTEELWTATGDGRAGDTIMLAAWPEALPADALAAAGIREEAVRYVDGKHDLIRAGRTLRADYGIAPAAKVAYIVRPNTAEDAARLLADLPSVISLLRAERVTVDAQFAPGQAVPGGLSALGMIYMPVEGLIDVAAEQARLAGQIEKASAERSRVAQKLGNPGFVNKAPAEVVEQQRERQRELDERVEKLRRLMAMLGTG